MVLTEKYKKFKDTDRMKEFEDWYYVNGGIVFLESGNIKDIWGRLIVFAETKGYLLEITDDSATISKWGNVTAMQKGWQCINSKIGLKSLEKSMNWCAKKFFELKRK